jgi:Ca-activated chloride channel family protein
MKRLATLLLFLGLAAPINVCAQASKVDTTADDVIRVSTSLVTVPVRVMDRHGKMIPGLKQDQFHVFEDGVEQEIAYFEPPAIANDAGPNATQKPFTVALLLDVSDSTESKLAQIQSTALVFINLLRPEDRVIVVAFDQHVRVLAEATNDRSVLREAIVRTRTGGGTSLYGALDTVISERLSRIAGRKAIVLLTDGVDTSSKGATAESTVRAAQASDVTIYPVQYNTYGDFADNSSRETYGAGDFGAVAHQTKNGEPASEAYKRATLFLRLLADKTGGYFQYTDKNLSRSFERIAVQLRQQYSIGYYPKNKTSDAVQRQIKVVVGVPKVTVNARRWYIYKLIDKQ